ncbi:transmembrane and death domain protein 1-like [Erpetoichthys calabaricus]|uniref:transmembrane and death domain protein 1-like n=1 Tax=Erpetoichthys calabaricus TaxID=27687 RepID=UPI0022341933|nr:transmembrane and death domain protein 1-like [Erpetoichthys calabaricus]
MARACWAMLILLVPLISWSCYADDTVADDIGIHQMTRIVELLSPQECQDLYRTLTTPEKDMLKEAERLSKSNMAPLTRKKRDITSIEQCKEVMMNWLSSQGQGMPFDRLFRALEQVGRDDIAVEMGKNINQDKILGLKKYVENYQKGVESMQSALVADDSNKEEGNVRTIRDLSEISTEEMELIIEREQLPPYDRSMHAWIWPVVYGIVSAFGGTLILAGGIAYWSVSISRYDLEEIKKQLAAKKKGRAKRKHSAAKK